MSEDQYQPVQVSRRIEAPAEVIFRILADPGMHTALDGTGMLRGAVTTEPVTRTGDVFVMKMYYVEHGDYEMNNHVVEFEPDRRIGWEPEAGRGHPATAPGSTEPGRWGHRWTYDLVPDGPGATVVTEIYDCSRVPADARVGMDGGQVWIEGMTQTLERLAVVCAEQVVEHG
jgi:Polyketide cyclase / dehydrase and lipid transport